jgi:hypothetical protein
MQKVLETITAALAGAERPAILTSFGKESVLLTQLVLDAGARPDLIFFRRDKRREQLEFAFSEIARLGLDVYDWAPADRYFLPRGTNAVALVDEYAYLDLTLPVLRDIEHDQTAQCVFDLDKTRTTAFIGPWDTIFLGTRGIDTHEIIPEPRLVHILNGRDVSLVAPLYHLSEEDVWREIRARRIAYDVARYDESGADPDTLHMCVGCLKKPDSPGVVEKVPCHKIGGEIDLFEWDRAQAHAAFLQRFAK